eukprot:COSAG02_NODE_478_length_21511_cov_120.811087_2_plen_315_part_00
MRIEFEKTTRADRGATASATRSLLLTTRLVVRRGVRLQYVRAGTLVGTLVGRHPCRHAQTDQLYEALLFGLMLSAAALQPGAQPPMDPAVASAVLGQPHLPWALHAVARQSVGPQALQEHQQAPACRAPSSATFIHSNLPSGAHFSDSDVENGPANPRALPGARTLVAVWEAVARDVHQCTSGCESHTCYCPVKKTVAALQRLLYAPIGETGEDYDTKAFTRVQNSSKKRKAPDDAETVVLVLDSHGMNFPREQTWIHVALSPEITASEEAAIKQAIQPAVGDCQVVVLPHDKISIEVSTQRYDHVLREFEQSI